MVHTRSNRLLCSALLSGLLTGVALVEAAPAAAQESYRILIPKRFQRQGDINKGFGEDLSDELKKLMEDLPGYVLADKKEVENLLDRYKLDDDDLADCTMSRQLATQAGYELVLCGTYAAAGNGFSVQAYVINPIANETFNVPSVTAARPREAAQQIFSSFNDFRNLLSLTVNCNDYLRGQNWNEALQFCDNALAINDSWISALYGRGMALLNLERYDESMRALARVLELDPVREEAILAAGFVAAKQGDLDASRRYYRQYLDMNPGNAQVRLTVADDAAKAGDPAGALQIAEQGLQGDSVSPVLAEFAGYYAAAAAAKAAEEAAASTPPGMDGGLPADVQVFYEKAAEYLRQAYEARPDSVQPNLFPTYLNALNKLRRTQEAAEFGAMAVAARPDDVQLWNLYASVLRDAGRLEEALAALDTVVALAPETRMVRARQGQWLLQSGDIEGAVAAFRQAVERQELASDTAALQFLAIAVNDYASKQQYDPALPYLEASLQFATEPRTQGMAHYFLGFIHYTKAEAVARPGTLQSANASLPLFQQVMRHLEAAKPYAEIEPSVASTLQQLVSGTQRYIEIQNMLIERGR